MIRAITALALAALALLAGCSGPKPAPGWPDGTPRPINASTAGKVQR